MSVQVIGLSVGPWPMNCYVVGEARSRQAWVVDPGAEVGRIQAVLAEERWEIRAIVQTHGHVDHIAGTAALRAATGVPVLAHGDEVAMFANERVRQFGGEPLVPDRLFGDGEVVQLGDVDFVVHHVPGHTPGHVALVGGGVCLSGDVLFRVGCGRTDLPGGDFRLLERSLVRLLGLPDEVMVYPGHGPMTTIGYARRCNPYVPVV